MGLRNYFHPLDKDAAPPRPSLTTSVAQTSATSAAPSPPPMSIHSSPVFLQSSTNPNERSDSTGTHSSDKGKFSRAPGSACLDGDFRNIPALQLMEIKADLMVNWLHQQQQEKMWIGDGCDEGVVLKKAKDDYVCCPPALRNQDNGLYHSFRKLNVKVSSLASFVSNRRS